MRVATAELHGARLEVASAPQPGLVGVEGIVVGDTHSTWRLATPPDGKVRTVPKAGATFHLHWQTTTFTLHGDHFVGPRACGMGAAQSDR